MKRLYALTDKCIKNKEPVLLVGETGCGKTTVCQLISLFESVPIYTISCHQNTEAADFIGGLRTVTSRPTAKELEGKLREGIEELARTLEEASERLEAKEIVKGPVDFRACLLYTSPSPRD
eukprot:TRINITY_DN7254_c0_g1_i1.p1 TRINITY_DN7254_c0_g1~~TRINITY_DN7254_c0_g1_i1.p1  ORF type:complete len:121 (-),score=44.35 TRINITY_DN7254_c0_g1_i1:48-410(-)